MIKGLLQTLCPNDEDSKTMFLFKKEIPYLFEYKSHFFVPKYHSKKSGATYTRIHEVHCMPYKVFLRCFLAIELYTVSFYLIISLIAFHASSIALSTLSPFFYVLMHLAIIYPFKLRCITCHLDRMLVRLFQR